MKQIPKQRCQLCLVQTTLFRSGVDYESYNFYKSSCKILRYCIYRRDGGWEGRMEDLLHIM